jgi:hypothetical protein
MNFIAKFAWAALAIALVANADTPGKASSSSEGTSTPFSRPESGWSGWAFVPLERDGVVSLRKTKDFHDTQFQYRWKSELNVSRNACTIEIRDVDNNHTVPEIDVYYLDHRGPGHLHTFSAHEVSVDKLAHAYLKPNDCERVEAVVWKK